MPWPRTGTLPPSWSPCARNFRVKYQELSIGFENLAYLQSIENKCNVDDGITNILKSEPNILISDQKQKTRMNFRNC